MHELPDSPYLQQIVKSFQKKRSTDLISAEQKMEEGREDELTTRERLAVYMAEKKLKKAFSRAQSLGTCMCTCLFPHIHYCAFTSIQDKTNSGTDLQSVCLFHSYMYMKKLLPMESGGMDLSNEENERGLGYRYAKAMFVRGDVMLTFLVFFLIIMASASKASDDAGSTNTFSRVQSGFQRTASLAGEAATGRCLP
jgi:hypothetical protein